MMRACAPAWPPAAPAGARLRVWRPRVRSQRGRGLRVCAVIRESGGSLDVIPPQGLVREATVIGLGAVLFERSEQVAPGVDVLWADMGAADAVADDADDAAPEPEAASEPAPESAAASGLFAGLRSALEAGAAAISYLANDAFDKTALSSLAFTVERYSAYSSCQEPWPSEDADAYEAVSAMQALLFLAKRPAPTPGSDDPLPVGCTMLSKPGDSELPDMDWNDLTKVAGFDPAEIGPLLEPLLRAERRIGALLASICREDVPAGLLQAGDPPVEFKIQKRRAGQVGVDRLLYDYSTQYTPQTGGLEGKAWADTVGLVTQGLRVVGRVIWSEYCPQASNVPPELGAPSAEAAPPNLVVLVPPVLGPDIALIEAHVRSFLQPHAWGHACAPSIWTDLAILDDSLRVSPELVSQGVMDWSIKSGGFLTTAVRQALTRLIRSGRRDAARLLAWHCLRKDAAADSRAKAYLARYAGCSYLHGKVMDIRTSYTDDDGAKPTTFSLFLEPEGFLHDMNTLVVAFISLDDSDDVAKRYVEDAMYTATHRRARLFMFGFGGSGDRDASTARLVTLVAEVSSYAAAMSRITRKMYEPTFQFSAEDHAELQSIVRCFPEIPEYSAWTAEVFALSCELARMRLKAAFSKMPLYMEPDYAKLSTDAYCSLVIDRELHDQVLAFPGFAQEAEYIQPLDLTNLPAFSALKLPGLSSTRAQMARLLATTAHEFKPEIDSWQKLRAEKLEAARKLWDAAAKSAKAEVARKRAEEKQALDKAEAERKAAISREKAKKREAEKQAALAAAAEAAARKLAARQELMAPTLKREAELREAQKRRDAEAAQKRADEKAAADAARAAAEAAAGTCAAEAAAADADGWPLSRWQEAEPRWRAALATAGSANSPSVEALSAALATLKSAGALAGRIAATADASNRAVALERLQSAIAAAEASREAVRRLLSVELKQAAQTALKLSAEAELISALQSRDPERISAAVAAATGAGADLGALMLEATSQVPAAQLVAPPESTRPAAPGNWVAAGPKLWFDDSSDTALGFGSGTVVYRAVFINERGKPEDAAVKRIVKEQEPERWEKQQLLAKREYDISRSVAAKSTSVVNPLDFWEGRNFIFIGFSRCKQSLRQLLEQRKERLRLPVALTHLRDLATAVDELHGAGYAHNDLHAGNVLFTDAGELKVADLQLSMRTGSDADNTQLSMNGNTLNMKNRAPEVQRFAQLPRFRQEQTQLTSAVDIFSIGVIGMQLLTGDAALEVQLRSPLAPSTPRGGRGSPRQPAQRGPAVPNLSA